FSKLQLLLEVTIVVMVARKLDGRRKRSVGLNENFPGCLPASGTTGHLGEELKGAFAGAEIRQMKSEIGVDNSHESHVRKMQALGDHLCPDKNIDFGAAKSVEGFAVSFLPSHRICIHSPNDCMRKERGHVGLDFFSAKAGVDERILSTFRAPF